MNRENIPFNIPYVTGDELDILGKVIDSQKFSGNGIYTKKCQSYFETNYGFKKVLLTTSCTDALEMCAILAEIKAGDEVIVPSYTFVSTALAFIRQGAKIVFADSYADKPNIDATKIESLITSKTKAIVPVHYAGVACDMDLIMSVARKFNLLVIEDAAQSIDSFYKGKPLGSIGHLATFSFHETKNIISGEGGLLVVNDERFITRAEIIWEKGTNRSEFFRGTINKYGWVDVGSSFLPSELVAGFLWAQIQHLENIQERRKYLWERYYNSFKSANIVFFEMPLIPDYATNNAHMFYLVCKSLDERTRLASFLQDKGVQANFHYLSLHKSNYYIHRYEPIDLPYSEKFSDRLLRLPLYKGLTDSQADYVIDSICEFAKKTNN